MKDRKKPTSHRQGNLVKLLDLVQRFSEMRHDEDYWVFDKTDIFDKGHLNSKYHEELDEMMKELREFDITEIGNLYLTSGGRVVLDKGYGEYFGKSDKIVFTLDQLTSGISYKKFMERLKDVNGEK